MFGRFYSWLHENGNTLKLPITIQVEDTVDCDEEYSEIRDAFGMPHAFDQMVEALGRIVALDVIDSVTVSEAIAKLRAILKSNRKGSQAAIFATMNYADLVLRIVKGYASKIGGPAVKAFEDTYQDAKSKVEKVNQEFRRKGIEKLVDPQAIKRFIASGVVETAELRRSLPAGFLEVNSEVSTDENGNTLSDENRR